MLIFEKIIQCFNILLKLSIDTFHIINSMQLASQLSYFHFLLMMLRSTFTDFFIFNHQNLSQSSTLFLDLLSLSNQFINLCVF